MCDKEIVVCAAIWVQDHKNKPHGPVNIKAFERARRGKDISFFERQEKESGFNFLYNPNNGRMQSGHIIIDGIDLFKQIIHER